MAETGTSRPPASGTDAGDFPELLGFCARAEALIAELLLLSDRAPPLFADRRFDPVLFDFRYFDSPGDFEARIDGNIELEALEDQLRDSCGSYMQRFFSFLDGAVTYHGELCNYLNDLQEGLYVHCTLDHVLENNCACQLLVESMTLFGCMILIMEHKIGGLLRERLLVAHLRYKRCFSYPNLEQICELCRRHVPTPVDLLVSWDAYKEAKSSLVSCLSPTSIRDISLHHYTKVPYFLADLDIHMHAINKEYVLNNSQSLLSVIRECNFTLRWLLLHRMNNLAIEGLRRQQCGAWRQRPSGYLQACFTIFADHLSRRDSDQRRDVDAEIGEVLPICLRKDM